ncbi:PilN domain-containing protein [Solidesulfovibrio sp.]|uniref:PilN domain-containing protein n=1 Tax=Solidesulfovibrio sp. TaxID=2910990 RepID=UPI002B215828|nr:PilN domain-containing protein [Solidesulfovibrio sp.]MEA4858705.1 PilN domain-containing protein [Solidesulfovibrio sp.]
MPASILSMLCRADGVRLLRLAGPRGRMRIANLAEASPGDGETTPAALAALGARTALAEGLGAERLMLGLDGNAACLRRLRFPFTARGKIDLVLGPEFEPHLPFPLSEAALSWARTALEPPPAAVALAAAYPLGPLAAMLETLAGHLLPATEACLDLAGLDAVLARMHPSGASLLVCLDGGHAAFVCRLGGSPAIWRSLPVPAGDLPGFLAREALLTLSAITTRPLPALRVVLAGPCDATTRASLGEALAVPATPAAEMPTWPRLPDGAALPDRFAAVYGLALLSRDGAGSLNFLRGALTPPMPAGLRRRGLTMAGGSLAALVASAVLGLFVSYNRLDTAIAAAQARTAALVDTVAPDAAPGLTLSQKLSVLRGRLAELDGASRNRAATSGTTIEFLAAIHTALGMDDRVRARRIALDDQHATIDATADDYNTVDEVKRRLSATPFFSDVEIKGAKNVPEKKQVEFQLDIRFGRKEAGAS